MNVIKEIKDLPWYVLCTKARFEKKVAYRLKEAGYNVYCPLQKHNRQWSDRTKVVEEPLFKSYLFIQIEDHRRDEVFAFPGITRYLYWMHRPAQVRQVEINTIKKLLGDYNHKDIDISHIQPGDYVYISTGQFSGKEGFLIDRTKHRAIVQLKELGVQLSLSLSNNDLFSFEK